MTRVAGPGERFGGGVIQPVEVSVLEQGATALITVSGELDIATMPLVRSAVARLAGHAQVVLDLEGVSFIDAFAVGAIVSAGASLGAGAGCLRVVGAAPGVYRVFELTGVLAQVEVHPLADPSTTATEQVGGHARRQQVAS